MKICVLMKQIPDPASALRIRADERWVDDSHLVYSANESDSYALEEALLLKEAHGGEVVAVTAGSARTTQMLKDALAKGADRAIHVARESDGYLDSHGMAHLFAATLRAEAFDLILTGLQSDDTGHGQLGPMLAELLDLPHVTLVVATEIDGTSMQVKQELEGGWFQNVTASMPVLLTIQSGINKPRYASLKGIMAMKSKEIKEVLPGGLGIDPQKLQPMQTVGRIYLPVKSKETVFLEGSPAEVAEQLVEKLTNDAKVL